MYIYFILLIELIICYSAHGYQGVYDWSRQRDIFLYKKMFIPIHSQNHWCLICVNFIKKTIAYYDSLISVNYKCLISILEYLQDEFEDKYNEKLDISDWQLINARDCPIQKNSYDCGVFTCIIAEYLARDAVLDFTQDDMFIFRHRISYEILNGSLCF